MYACLYVSHNISLAHTNLHFLLLPYPSVSLSRSSTSTQSQARNTSGQTAYKLAVDSGNQQVAKLLLEYMRDYKVQVQVQGQASLAPPVIAQGSPVPPAHRRSIDNSSLRSSSGPQLRIDLGEFEQPY